MSIVSDINFFVNVIFPIMILLIGLVGNSFGFKILLNRNLINIGPRLSYLFLFAIDMFYLLQIIGTNLQYNYNLNISVISSAACKIWNFFNYSLATISPWLTVYISIDRYISIQHPAWRFTMRKNNVQIIYFMFTLITHLLFYIPVILYLDIKNSFEDSFNQTDYMCDFVDTHAVNLISYMDLAMRVIIPFSIMFVFSLLLSYAMFASRKRIVENFLAEENQTFYKEIRLATSSICLNLIYIFLQLPVSLTIFYGEYFNNLFYVFTYYLFYLSYAVNFYILLPTNTLFRHTFFNLFKNS